MFRCVSVTHAENIKRILMKLCLQTGHDYESWVGLGDEEAKLLAEAGKNICPVTDLDWVFISTLKFECKRFLTLKIVVNKINIFPYDSWRNSDCRN